MTAARVTCSVVPEATRRSDGQHEPEGAHQYGERERWHRLCQLLVQEEEKRLAHHRHQHEADPDAISQRGNRHALGMDAERDEQYDSSSDDDCRHEAPTWPFAECSDRQRAHDYGEGAQDNAGVGRRGERQSQDQQDRVSDAARCGLNEQETPLPLGENRNRLARQPNQGSEDRTRDRKTQGGRAERRHPFADDLAGNRGAADEHHGGAQEDETDLPAPNPAHGRAGQAGS
jgi:hypothetical protein